MIKIKQATLLTVIGLVLGCASGAPDTSDPGTPPPHGGSLVELPGGDGYVEVVPAGDPRGSAGTAFYVLKDMATPYEPAPTSGTLAIGQNEVKLEARDGGLVVPAGGPPFRSGAVEGHLSTDLGGKVVTVPLGLR